MIDWWLLYSLNILAVSMGFHTYVAHILTQGKPLAIRSSECLICKIKSCVITRKKKDDQVISFLPANSDDENENDFLLHARKINNIGKILFVFLTLSFNLVFWAIAAHEFSRPAEEYLDSQIKYSKTSKMSCRQMQINAIEYFFTFYWSFFFKKAFSIWYNRSRAERKLYGELESFISHKYLQIVRCLTCIQHVYLSPKPNCEKNLSCKKKYLLQYNFYISLCSMHGNIFEAVGKMFHEVSQTSYSYQL